MGDPAGVEERADRRDLREGKLVLLHFGIVRAVCFVRRVEGAPLPAFLRVEEHEGVRGPQIGDDRRERVPEAVDRVVAYAGRRPEMIRHPVEHPEE